MFSRIALISLTGCVALGFSSLSHAATFETPRELRAGQFLPAELLSGPEWQIEPQVANDGFDNIYTLQSRFGTWQERGRVRAQERVIEIQAMAELEKVARSDVFMDAVKNSATAPFELVANVAQRPVETAMALPKAMGRWFRTTGFRVSETFRDVSQPEEPVEGAAEQNSGADTGAAAQSYALDYLKITKSERQWYAKLHVDPATDNVALSQAVSSVARVQGLTSFGMSFAGLPRIPGASAVRTAMNIVWETDPWELRRLNRQRMLAAGLSEATARKFEDNRALTPTVQTALLDALVQLPDVKGRGSIIARAIDAKDREEAGNLLASVVLLVQFHRTQAPLGEILEGTRLPVARTRNGELMAAMATDALYWTKAMSDAAAGFAKIYARDKATRRTIWITGKASPQMKAGVEALGWKIRDGWQPPD